MSAKLVETTALKPKSASAQTACPRELPQAKFVAGDEDLRTLFHLKLGAIFEQMRSDAHFVCHLQKTRGDDLIGVDVFLRNDDDAR